MVLYLKVIPNIAGSVTPPTLAVTAHDMAVDFTFFVLAFNDTAKVAAN